jgi:iron complex transport system substrate-binding protein
MRSLKLLAGLLAAFLLIALAGCSDDDSDGGETTPTDDASTAAAPDKTQPPAFPLTMTDDVGVKVTLEEPPGAIVALAPSFVEVIFDLGAGDSIVAADTNADYPIEAEAIPKISGFSPSLEGIASYNPDLVLIFYDPGDLQTSLIDLGIPTMYLATPTTIDGVYAQIETLGQIVDRPVEAQAIVSRMQTDISAIVGSVDTSSGPSYYFEIDNTYYSVGPGSFPDEVFAMLGATNIAESASEAYPQLSTEAIVAAEPEVIILADVDFGESAETVAARPGWDAIPAVQNDRVYGVPAALLQRPTARLVDDVQQVAELLYTES